MEENTENGQLELVISNRLVQSYKGLTAHLCSFHFAYLRFRSILSDHTFRIGLKPWLFHFLSFRGDVRRYLFFEKSVDACFQRLFARLGWNISITSQKFSSDCLSQSFTYIRFVKLLKKLQIFNPCLLGNPVGYLRFCE